MTGRVWVGVGVGAWVVKNFFLSVVFYTEHEIKDAGTLFVVVSIVTYIICFAIYALFISNKYTRMMFGLLEVK